MACHPLFDPKSACGSLQATRRPLTKVRGYFLGLLAEQKYEKTRPAAPRPPCDGLRLAFRAAPGGRGIRPVPVRVTAFVRQQKLHVRLAVREDRDRPAPGTVFRAFFVEPEVLTRLCGVAATADAAAVEAALERLFAPGTITTDDRILVCVSALPELEGTIAADGPAVVSADLPTGAPELPERVHVVILIDGEDRTTAAPNNAAAPGGRTGLLADIGDWRTWDAHPFDAELHRVWTEQGSTAAVSVLAQALVDDDGCAGEWPARNWAEHLPAAVAAFLDERRPVETADVWLAALEERAYRTTRIGRLGRAALVRQAAIQALRRDDGPCDVVGRWRPVPSPEVRERCERSAAELPERILVGEGPARDSAVDVGAARTAHAGFCAEADVFRRAIGRKQCVAVPLGCGGVLHAEVAQLNAPSDRPVMLSPETEFFPTLDLQAEINARLTELFADDTFLGGGSFLLNCRAVEGADTPPHLSIDDPALVPAVAVAAWATIHGQPLRTALASAAVLKPDGTLAPVPDAPTRHAALARYRTAARLPSLTTLTADGTPRLLDLLADPTRLLGDGFHDYRTGVATWGVPRLPAPFAPADEATLLRAAHYAGRVPFVEGVCLPPNSPAELAARFLAARLVETPPEAWERDAIPLLLPLEWVNDRPEVVVPQWLKRGRDELGGPLWFPDAVIDEAFASDPGRFVLLAYYPTADAQREPGALVSLRRLVQRDGARPSVLFLARDAEHLRYFQRLWRGEA